MGGAPAGGSIRPPAGFFGQLLVRRTGEHSTSGARTGVPRRSGRRIRTKDVFLVGVIAVRDVGEVVWTRVNDHGTPVGIPHTLDREPVRVKPRSALPSSDPS